MRIIIEQFDSQTAIRHHLQLLGHDGFGVTELRIFGNHPMVAYIDNIEDIIRLAKEKDGKVDGIYVGVQPRSVDFFERAPNCWQPAIGGDKSNCACDKDIEYITAIFFDIDVVSSQRKKGYPASDNELQNTLKAAQLLGRQDGLALCSTICCSGNGHYVLVPIVPIPLDSEVAAQLKQFCKQLTECVVAKINGAKFDFVFNLSRVMRLMGTVNRKGTETSDRPHRRAHFVTEPFPAMSQAAHHMILNTEVAVPQEKNKITSGTIKCDLAKIEGCDFIKWCRTHPTEVTEPQWFAMISNLARLEGGQKLIHQISALDKSRYDYRQTQRLIERILCNGYGQTNCEKLASLGFHCPKLGRCQAKAPMYMTSLYTKYS